MKPIPCTVVCNTKWGLIGKPYYAKSIAEGVRYAKKSGYFAYRIFVGKKLKLRGFCD